jgi:2-aminobenzoate-CoA ligase
MKDTYPRLDTLPHEWLVGAAGQPDYLPLPGMVLDERMDLGRALSDGQVARGLGDVIAIVHHETDRLITFRELAELSHRTAAALCELGVSPGDRVAIRGPNSPEFIIVAIAAWKAGAVVALIPALARQTDVEFFLADTEPTVAVLLQPEAPEIVAAFERAPGLRVVTARDLGVHDAPRSAAATARRVLPAPDLDRVAIVWHTGGTTGRPKGCYHTQRRFLLGGFSLGRATGAAPGQRWAAAAPMGHALGFIHSTIFTLLHGVTLVVISDFAQPATVLEAISARGVTQFTAIAATWGSMHDLLVSAGGPAPQALSRGYAMWQSSSASEVTDGWRRRGIELLNNFGSTAFATWILVPPLDRHVPRAWLGTAAPGYEVVAIDTELAQLEQGIRPLPAGQPGRMAVRGPTGLTYWRLPAKQHEDVRFGYSLHDDLICFGTGQDEGLAEYLGRTDFLISTAGNKVAPVEVEDVLSSHPAVREAVVFGLPDPARQEIVAAFVVLRSPEAASDELRQELQNLVKARLAPYKYPRRLDFIEAVPRDTVGKVQPRILRDQVLRDGMTVTTKERR